jgi:hypothetical protein
MIGFRRVCLALLAAGALSFAGAQTSQAASHNATNTLAVKIAATPTSSTIWGSVKVTYTKGGKMHTVGVCKKASCVFHPPTKTKLVLVETPENSTTWPFKNWNVKTGGSTKTHTSKKISVSIMGGKATVTATYHLPGM